MGHEMPTPQEPAEPMDHSAMGHEMRRHADGHSPMNHAADRHPHLPSRANRFHRD